MNAINTYKPQTMTHPSEILVERLEELGLSLEEFSAISNITLLELNSFINDKCLISEIFAEKLEKSLKIPSTFWLNLQNKYNEIMVGKINLNTKVNVLKPKFKTNTNIN